MMEDLERNIVGHDTVFQGPFGPRRSIYMDYTASGQSLRCIEDFIVDNVLPCYGNTHTTSNFTASQTTAFRDEAREIVRESVGASKEDVVLFCGYGGTGAVHKLVQAVSGRGQKPPIVFVGPFEHHSSFLPWKDIGADVTIIPETLTGAVDVALLEEKLDQVVSQGIPDRLVIGCFSAASNVTGAVTDDVAVTVLLHKYGALSFWDFTAAAPHLKVSMNPKLPHKSLQALARKDALFFAGHKFLGGPQTPGVLVAKDEIFQNPIPNGAGGGTVLFVTKDSHHYLQDTEQREEGGTPAIVESIRLGLVFKIKESIGVPTILQRESIYTKKILREWGKCPEIKILGSRDNPRLGIISFLIEHQKTGYLLHHNFVVALLNDLYGIQSRGGCACAGPYAQTLLGIDSNMASTYANLLLRGCNRSSKEIEGDNGSCSPGCTNEIFKPGFVRITIPFHASPQEIKYLIEAVKQIASFGYKLLPLYNADPNTGEFAHYLSQAFLQRKWLSWIKYKMQGVTFRGEERKFVGGDKYYPSYKECLKEALGWYNNAYSLCKGRDLAGEDNRLSGVSGNLRWFLSPHEAHAQLVAEVEGTVNELTGLPRSSRPFRPKTYSAYSSHSIDKFYPNSVPSQIPSELGKEKIPFRLIRLQEKVMNAAQLNPLMRYPGLVKRILKKEEPQVVVAKSLIMHKLNE